MITATCTRCAESFGPGDVPAYQEWDTAHRAVCPGHIPDERARELVAQQVVADTVRTMIEDGDEWENYPEIGEHDWNRIMGLAEDLAPAPDRELYDRAYAILQAAAVAEGVEP